MEINIGKYIESRVKELNLSTERICNFLKKEEAEILQMYKAPSLDSELLLRWSKLLEYDFFRVYSQHLILYSPSSSERYNAVQGQKDSSVPKFRKNIYTKEVINFIMEMIKTEEKTKNEIIKEYRIPKTTLYKWISKYKTEN